MTAPTITLAELVEAAQRVTGRVPTCSIRVESYATNPPKPIGFVIKDEEGATIGVLEYTTVARALELFNAMSTVCAHSWGKV